MRRIAAALLAASLLSEIPRPAACAPAEAAGPFEAVVSPPPRRTSHFWAYASMAGGAALVGASFHYHARANQAYDDYLVATDPSLIEDLYDRSARYDRLSAAALLTGEGLVVAGLALRFIRRPSTPRVSLLLAPDRCALSCRF